MESEPKKNLIIETRKRKLCDSIIRDWKGKRDSIKLPTRKGCRRTEI